MHPSLNRTHQKKSKMRSEWSSARFNSSKLFRKAYYFLVFVWLEASRNTFLSIPFSNLCVDYEFIKKSNWSNQFPWLSMTCQSVGFCWVLAVFAPFLPPSQTLSAPASSKQKSFSGTSLHCKSSCAKAAVWISFSVPQICIQSQSNLKYVAHEREGFKSQN